MAMSTLLPLAHRAKPVAALLASTLLAGCGSPAPSGVETDGGPPMSASIRAEFRADPPNHAGEEAYVCYSFQVEALDGIQLGGVSVRPPSGPVVLHHASLYAAAGLPDVGEVPCDPMPERVAALGVYTPGAVSLSLPAGVGISLPQGTSRLIVAAHVLRVGEGAAEPTYVELKPVAVAPEHVINWVDVFAPVPVLAPHDTATSSASCRFDLPVHVVTVWPHMHRLGTRAHADVVRADRTREVLMDVDPWDVEHQPIYPVDVELQPGDAIEGQCVWTNTTPQPVMSGPYSYNEMCNHGLFVWPFDHAFCAP
jgi:hypothetical protein